MADVRSPQEIIQGIIEKTREGKIAWGIRFSNYKWFSWYEGQLGNARVEFGDVGVLLAVYRLNIYVDEQKVFSASSHKTFEDNVYFYGFSNMTTLRKLIEQNIEERKRNALHSLDL